MAGKYVLGKTSNGEYLFNLKAGNGETILTSQRYGSKGAAETGIASVQVNSPLDARYEMLTSSAGQPYFVLKGANGEVIGTSEMYSSTSARQTGIDSVKQNGPSATVDDKTA